MRIRHLGGYTCFFAFLGAVMAWTINLGGPSYPSTSIPVSTEALGSMQSAVETAISKGAESGTVTFNFNEPELTSYLSYALEARLQDVISKPQVFLRDDEIQIYGTATQGYFVATVRLVFRAIIDDQGQLRVELTSANFGPLPVPNGLTEIVTTTIQEAYTGALGPVATGFRLLSVNVADGSMTITGQIK